MNKDERVYRGAEAEEEAMTAVLPDRPDVLDATDEDMREAVREALEHCGFSFHQLEEQARTGHFETLAARLAWVAVGGLRHLAPE